MRDRIATELTRGFVMNKAALFTAASVLALCAGNAALARPIPVPAFVASTAGKAPMRLESAKAHTLYNQNSNDSGEYADSTNLTTSYVYGSQGADDFVIPKGRSWRIMQVDLTGVYYDGRGPANSENVTFYKDAHGIPGVAVNNGTFDNLDGTGGPNFSIVLPGKGLKLRAGHYWVSVVANMQFTLYGLWGAEVSTAQHNYQAMWQNPGGGFGICQTWGTIEKCLGVHGPDLMFDLKGTSKRN